MTGRLVRGARLVEILKQPQFQPLPVAKQILMIYAATSGSLTAVPESAVARYERELYAYFDTEQAELLNQLQSTGVLDDALKESIDAALKAFGESFGLEEGE